MHAGGCDFAAMHLSNQSSSGLMGRRAVSVESYLCLGWLEAAVREGDHIVSMSSPRARFSEASDMAINFPRFACPACRCRTATLLRKRENALGFAKAFPIIRIKERERKRQGVQEMICWLANTIRIQVACRHQRGEESASKAGQPRTQSRRR